MSHERAEEHAATAEPAAVPSPRAPAAPQVARVLALQRTAGNAAVNRLLSRQPTSETPSGGYKMGPTRHVCFIMSAENDSALTQAIRHYTFALNYPTGILLTPKEFEPTLFGIFKWLSENITDELTDITIVSHGNRQGQLNFGVDKKDDKWLTPDELKTAVRGGKLPKIPAGVVTTATTIHLKACMVGNNAEVVELWDEAFGGEGVVAATKVKVGYNAELMAKQGLGGWWVDSTRKLTDDEFAKALEDKYGDKVDLDELPDNGGRATTRTKTEQWKAMAVKPKIHEWWAKIDGKSTKIYTYMSTTLLRKDRDTDEFDPTLYSRSVYGDKHYMPTEI